MTFNNLGFNVASDFSMPPSAEFISQYAAKPGEKLVLITGGSVVHGVGATSNENTIAAQLEATLNARQSTYKYRVLNLGMGSWIAYQQFLGLSLFGLALKPDWIVDDGRPQRCRGRLRTWHRRRQSHELADVAVPDWRWRRRRSQESVDAMVDPEHLDRPPCNRRAAARSTTLCSIASISMKRIRTSASS